MSDPSPKYEGEFKSSFFGLLGRVRHGRGTFTDEDGNVYDGLWSNGKKHGKGEMTWTDGRKYSGDWMDNACHGEGRMVFADSSMYYGHFANDKLHGSGVYVFPSGEQLIGTWIEGTVSEGHWTDAMGQTFRVELCAGVEFENLISLGDCAFSRKAIIPISNNADPHLQSELCSLVHDFDLTAHQVAIIRTMMAKGVKSRSDVGDLEVCDFEGVALSHVERRRLSRLIESVQPAGAVGRKRRRGPGAGGGDSAESTPCTTPRRACSPPGDLCTPPAAKYARRDLPPSSPATGGAEAEALGLLRSGDAKEQSSSSSAGPTAHAQPEEEEEKGGVEEEEEEEEEDEEEGRVEEDQGEEGSLEV